MRELPGVPACCMYSTEATNLSPGKPTSVHVSMLSVTSFTERAFLSSWYTKLATEERYFWQEQLYLSD